MSSVLAVIPTHLVIVTFFSNCQRLSFGKTVQYKGHFAYRESPGYQLPVSVEIAKWFQIYSHLFTDKFFSKKD
jgi:hypothetical protein